MSIEHDQINGIAKAICPKYKEGCAKCPDCYAIDEARRVYDAGYRRQSEWISVDERLPDGQGHFLIVNEEGKMITAFYTPRFGWFSGVRMRDITHWMPLPEAPKGGAE